MNGTLSRRIRKLMVCKFSTLDVFVRGKRISKVTKKNPFPEEWPWERVYRNVKNLYKRDLKDREFFEKLMKKENI